MPRRAYMDVFTASFELNGILYFGLINKIVNSILHIHPGIHCAHFE